MPKQKLDLGRNWYAIHVYAGYEDQVAEAMRQRVESFDMQDKIFSILVPKEKKIRIKNGKKETIEEKIFPSYVLVDMIVRDDSWYVVRNTPRVTGFIGTGTTPIPLSRQEIESITKRITGEEAGYQIELNQGDLVKIIDGPFKDLDGKIEEVDGGRGRVRVSVTLFGRETPVELDFLQVKKI